MEESGEGWSKVRESQPLGVETSEHSDCETDRVCVVRMSALRRFLQAACKAMHNPQDTPWVVIVRDRVLKGQEG